MRLQTLISWPAMLAARRQRLIGSLRREVGAANHAHLSLLNQLCVGLQRFIYRRSWIVTVRLVKINVVGLQSLERPFHLPHDPRFAQAFALPRNLGSYFGSDHNLVALSPALEPIAENCFALAALVPRRPGGIAVRGINEVQSCSHKGIQDIE